MRLQISRLALLASQTVFSAGQNLSFSAANFYRSDNVTLWPVTFPTQYQTIVAGNLFLPNDLDREANSSAIVVGHPMGAVKDQSSNLYATKMAEQGFVTLSLDLPFWGGSEGQPRQAVSPDSYAEAFSAAVDYLGTLDYVARDQIGAIGVCGSGSYVISAAKIDSRIRAIATSSMYDMGSAARNGLRRSLTVDQRKDMIAQASEQRWTEIDGGEVLYTGGTPYELTDETPHVGREFYDFYRTSRGLSTPASSAPNMTTQPTLSSNTTLLNFCPINDIETISPRPLLCISGDQAHSREFSEDAYERAQEPKELVWIAGAGHVDLYDRVGLIPFARLTEFFRTNLG